MVSGTIIPEQLNLAKIMGGKMNLNPLKKDDNTDALVQALEDANTVGSGQPGVTPTIPTNAPDDSTIASDPQIISAGITTDPNPVVASVSAVSSAVDTPTPTDDTGVATVTDTPATNASTTAAPTVDPTPAPVADTTAADDTTASDVDFSAGNLPEGMSDDADAHLTPVSSEGTGEGGELDGVKKSALEQLRPLIEKLDLEPADKFDKYLMMLRASDDPALIKPAFDAAQGIPGEKEKAQALLDIINEINYITTNQQA